MESETPKVGEVRKAAEINYKSTNKFIWHACEICGKKRWVQLRKGKPIKLMCLPCGARKANWKGGTRKHGGYIQVWLSPNDFFYPMANKTGYVYEHRLIVAKRLGRCLQPWEIVHHKRIRFKDIRNKSDNLEDNLQLVSDVGHRGITNMENIIRRLEKQISSLKHQVSVLEKQLKRR